MVDLVSSLSWGGLLLVAILVFAESGLLIGLFLPGDTLVFTAGLLAADGIFDVWWLFVVILVATVAGDQVGYALGRYFGRRLEERVPESFVRFSKKFFDRWGWLAVAAARFVPVVRTLIPFLAGATLYPATRFSIANFLGALLWTVFFLAAGYLLGSSIPNVRPILVIISVGGMVVAIAVGLVRYAMLKKRVRLKRHHA